MKYLLLAYGNEEKFNQMSKAELAEVGERCKGFDAEMQAAGEVTWGGSLSWDSKSMRLKNGKLTVTEGPFVETKEVVGGVVIIEQIFALPGIGRLVLDAITQRDYALVQGTVLFIAFNFLVVNLIVDLAYAALDPRIRLGNR